MTTGWDSKGSEGYGMNRYRSVSWVLLALVWLAMPVISPALDVNTSPKNEVGEAAQFFAEVAQNSKNPLIAQMARDSLLQLQTVKVDPSHLKRQSTAEVALLPQYDHTFVVPATVNRRYLATFLIDTGASYTVITPKMAASLGITIAADSPTVPVTTANGILHAPVVRLNHVSLGGLQVDNVDAVVTELGDSPQLSGLLGMSFFQGMDLSFKQDRLVISR
jgi:clan AA aspartic protease (TIGR02281 family)